MRCDICKWRIRKEDYNGSGECFRCFEGLMIKENGGRKYD